MHKFLTFAAAAAVTLMAGAAWADALSGADVEALLKGKTFNTADFGGKGTITWNADGTIAVSVKKDFDGPDGRGYRHLQV